MPSQIKGPALFLAQFAGDDAPYNSLADITKWAAGLGYKGVQIPTFDGRLFDLEKAATSDTYCDEVKGICADAGVEITELSTHLQGQLVAVNPAYDEAFDAFAPDAVKGNPKARTEWAISQVKMAADASRRLGLDHTVSLPNWPAAGCPFWTTTNRLALTSATKCTPARMFLTAQPLRCSLMPVAVARLR